MSGLMIILMIPIMISVILAIPPARRDGSWKRFFIAVFVSFAGIVFPIFIFLFSAALVPDWKGGCRFGWLDCFHAGKLVLSPLALWASAAFYVIQVLEPGRKPSRWVVLGIFSGMIVSTFCALFGLAIHSFKDVLQWWLVVPIYVAIWYSVLCVRMWRVSDVSPCEYTRTILASLPLWGISLVLSRLNYSSLPDHPPGCFVVTTTLRGHRSLVGPLYQIRRDGVARVANQQLLTFWCFEELWRRSSPLTHRLFRCCYNRVGPYVASLIQTEIRADLAYVMLKPCEMVASVIVWSTQRGQREKDQSMPKHETVDRG